MLLICIASCGRSPASPTASMPVDVHESPDPCAGDRVEGVTSCEGWQGWPRINAETFRSDGHQRAWVDVHVDPRFVEAYRAGTPPMPVGFRVVKAAHGKGGAPGDVTGLTVMVKMKAGYDPDHGDWYYGVYDASGTRASHQGKLEACIGCHAQWASHDHLAGVPGLWP